MWGRLLQELQCLSAYYGGHLRSAIWKMQKEMTCFWELFHLFKCVCVFLYYVSVSGSFPPLFPLLRLVVHISLVDEPWFLSPSQLLPFSLPCVSTSYFVSDCFNCIFARSLSPLSPFLIIMAELVCSTSLAPAVIIGWVLGALGILQDSSIILEGLWEVLRGTGRAFGSSGDTEITGEVLSSLEGGFRECCMVPGGSAGHLCWRSEGRTQGWLSGVPTLFPITLSSWAAQIWFAVSYGNVTWIYVTLNINRSPIRWVKRKLSNSSSFTLT